MGAFKLSYQHEKKTYDILVKQLGEEDSRTKDSLNWMNTFKMRQLQKGQTTNANTAQKAIDILKAFQAAAVAGNSSGSGVSANKSFSSAVIGEALPRGRGVDERTAEAAAEVRKKAAARGLMLPPQDLLVQIMPSTTQLFDIINSGTTQGATNDQDQVPVGLGSKLGLLDVMKLKKKSKEQS